MNWLGRLRGRIVGALAMYLAQPVSHNGSATAGAQSLAATLQPGDVLLTNGTTRAAALVRRITRSKWAHVAMYVGPLEAGPDPKCVVEADVAAGVRAVPLSEFNGAQVQVLRPRGLSDTDRRRLVDWVVGRIGYGYDFGHAWALAAKLLRLPFLSRLVMAPSAMAQSASQFICSTLLAQAFLLAGHPIQPVQLAARDAAADHRYVTPRDFESAAVFEVV